MDSTSHEENAFDWGIVGVDLDDINVAQGNSSDTASRVDRDPQGFTMASNSDFASIHLRPMNMSTESESIFDRFPKAFVSDSDERVDNTYSRMVQNPRQMAKCLSSNSPCLQYIAARPSNEPPINVEGETLMEKQFKRGLSNPYDYFFRATAFSCIMDLNNQGLVHPTILATLIGRLFNGDSGLLHVYNQFFMPTGLCIKYTRTCAAVHDILRQIGRHMDVNPTHAYHPHFSILIKVVHHLDCGKVSEGVHLDEIVGQLVYSSSGREFIPHPGAYTILRGPKLSPRFMSRSGKWWPYKDLPWQEADYLGLYRRTPKVKRKDPVETLDPRRLTVRARTWRGCEQ